MLLPNLYFEKKASLDPNCLKHCRPCLQFARLVKGTGRIILKQYLQYLQSNSLLEPFQSAYRKCHNTEAALLRLVNDLLQTSDSSCVSILSLFDLSAAFDTTDDSILITRLRATFGCSGTVLDWLMSYLSCHTQCVFVGHESTQSGLGNVECHRVLFWGPLPIYSVIKLPLFVSLVFHIISLQMIPSFTNEGVPS